ncbi:MAG: MFS transporter [Erysipelotrichaceae bacterium]|nr:MFS transporter [Erysipelotrichaceae bacterium]
MRIWTKEFIMVVLMSLFSGCAANMTYPLITKYTLTITPDLSVASTVAGLMSLSSLVICPFAGLITDRFNQKRILQISSIFYAAVLFSHQLATNIPMLVFMRLLVGIFFSINSVTSTAFSTNFIPKQRLAEGLGYAALANIVASAAGPAIGMKLVEISGYNLVFIVASICALSCMVMVTILPYEGRKQERKNVKFSLGSLMSVEYTDFMLIAALLSMGNSLVSTYLALIGDERGISNISLFFTVYSLMMVFLRPMVGKLQDKMGIYVIMIPAILFASMGIALIGVGKTLIIMLAASIFKAAGQGSGTPSLSAEVIRKLGKDKSGVATSTIMIGMNIGNAIGPMLSGLVVKQLGYRNLFVGFAVVSALLNYALLLFRYSRDRKNASATEESL